MISHEVLERIQDIQERARQETSLIGDDIVVFRSLGGKEVILVTTEIGAHHFAQGFINGVHKGVNTAADAIEAVGQVVGPELKTQAIGVWRSVHQEITNQKVASAA